MGLLLKFVGWCLPFINSIVGRIMLALGFGFVEFTGINLLIDSIMQQVNSSMGDFASSEGSLIAWAGLFKIDIHVSIVISAIGAKVLLNSLSGSKIRKIVSQ